MSIECLNQALKINGLTPTKKFILVILSNYADEEGTCYPSYSHIAKIIGLKTTKGVRLAIKEFEELGYLRIEHRIAEHGGYTSNKYHLTLGGISDDPSISNDQSLVSSDTSNTKDKTKTNTDSDSFIEFWKIYPNNSGSKRKAFESYNKAVHVKKKIDEDMLLNICKKFSNNMMGKDIKYIPHCTTWLNQERWETVVVFEKEKTNLNQLVG